MQVRQLGDRVSHGFVGNTAGDVPTVDVRDSQTGKGCGTCRGEDFQTVTKDQEEIRLKVIDCAGTSTDSTGERPGVVDSGDMILELHRNHGIDRAFRSYLVDGRVSTKEMGAPHCQEGFNGRHAVERVEHGSKQSVLGSTAGQHQDLAGNHGQVSDEARSSGMISAPPLTGRTRRRPSSSGMAAGLIP